MYAIRSYYENGSEIAYDFSVNGEKNDACTKIPVIKIPVKNGKTKQLSLNYIV